MSNHTVEVSQNGIIALNENGFITQNENGNITQNENENVTQNGDAISLSELEDIDFSKLLSKPRPLNMERQRSFDERSLAELSIGLSPRIYDHIESVFSPASRRSGFNTPRSQVDYEPHPLVAEAWDTLRRAIVHFRGQPVGTIAALDSSEEKLNYDQVKN